MKLCYVDESGSAETFTRAIPDSTPVFVLVGVSIPVSAQKSVIWEYLQLKKEFEPSLKKPSRRLSDVIKFEVKGSKLRRDIREGNRNTRRRATKYLDDLLNILEEHHCQIMGNVVVKEVDMDYDDATIYGKSVRMLAQTLNRQCDDPERQAMMVLDSRTKSKNESNVHVITTGRFKTGGDVYPNLIEAPTFGHSDTHVPLQIADILCSALIFPMATYAFCTENDWSVHVNQKYGQLRDLFGSRLRSLQYRYDGPNGSRCGGIDVTNHASSGPHPVRMFLPPNEMALV